MKPATFGAIGLLLAGSALQGQPWEITWASLAGGSGTGTSAVYGVSATIGQPEAGCMAGGAYTCEGGFWCIVAALQTPGGPLSVTLNPQLSTLTVSWPLPASGWVLDQALTLTGATIPWSEVPATQYRTNTAHISITIPAPVGNRFYRLRRP